jgi:pyruvate formate lyase activating enzyme
MDIILKDKVFYRNSGGGVTFSGGEPTMHMTYLHKLLKQLNKKEIHTCLETCGYYNPSEFNKLILPYLDLIYFDLKLYNQEDHNQFCKTLNWKILNNFEELINKKNVEVLPRIPLIPDITATKENLRGWVKYLKSHHIQKIALLPYNPLWISKAETIGKMLEYNHSKWLSDKDKKQIKDIFKDFDYRDF